MASTSKVNGCLGLGISEKDAVSMAKRAEKYSLGSEAANYAAAANDMLVELQNRRSSIQAAIDEAVKPVEKEVITPPVEIAPKPEAVTVAEAPKAQTAQPATPDQPEAKIPKPNELRAQADATAKPEVLPQGTVQEILKAAREYAEQRFGGKSVTNKDDGSEILIAKSGIKHALSGGAGRIDALAATDLENLIRNAKFLRTEQDKLNRPDIKATHYYSATLSVDDELKNIGVVVREHIDGNRYYDHFELRQKSASPPGVSGTASPGISDVLRSQPSSGDELSVPPAAPEVKEQEFTPDDVAAAERQALAAVQATGEKQKIGDFGKKIGGAKKDTWTGFKDDLSAVKDDDIAGRKLSEIWPAPDYQKMIDDGMDAKSVAVIRALRDEIPSKPRNSYKLKRWAEQVKTMRDLAANILNEKDTGAAIAGQLERGSSQMKGIAGRVDLYMAVGHDKSLEGIRLAHHHYSIYRGRENVSLWVAERDAAATAFSNWPQELAIGDTKEDAIAAFKARYAELDMISAVKKASFDIYSQDGKFFVGKKIGRNIAEMAGPFVSVKEARDYRANNLTELDAKLEKYKEIPKERRDTNEPRVGEDMRNGQDVTPEMFTNAFGFKGVEFGNWVEQKRRQKDLNDSFDALMDMAAIMGVPAKALSLNGELGLAFGARGSGGVNPAAAHYESDKIVINLTKREGAGSLGHEWWHALDNYFSRQRRHKTSPYMTTATDVSLSSRGSNYVPYEGVRKEMIDAFGEVVKAIRQTAIKARSSKMDAKRTKEYWTTGEEMAARAFESYLISKLQDQNASNDYLANVVDQKTWDAMAALGMQNEDSYPYPTAGEMPIIRAGFDKFVQTLETKETEGGNVAMFSRAGKPGHLSTAAVKTITMDIAKRWENAPTIIVVQDMNDPAIPERVRKQDAQQRSQGAAGDPEGFFFGNKVYIVANQMTSVSDVARVLFHETLGHFGLRGAFGKNLAPILKQIATLRKSDVTAKAAEYGLDMNKPNEVLQAAEEVLAEWAQTKPEMGFVKRAVAAIRQALRALGLNLRLTDEDIIASYLLPARGFVERARRAQGSSAGRLAFSLGGVDLDQQFQETAEAAGGPEAYAAAYQDGKTVLSYRQWVQVRTPNFKRWWGYDWESKQLSSGSSGADGQRKNSGRDSGVDGPIAREFTFIDESTKEPRLFYHGTRDAFTVFDADSEGKKDHGWLGRGHYVSSDHWVASHYSQNKKGAGDSVVMELFVRPNNPKYFTQKQKSAMSRANLFQVRKLTQEWRDQGHNGAALHAEDGPIELSVYDNNGLKSATSNTGLFSEAGDILFSRSLDSRTDTAQSQDFVVSDLASKFGNRLSDFRGMALQTLGRRQLVDIYAQDLPQLTSYSDMVAQMDADKNESGAEADGIATDWGALDESTLGSVGKYPGMERKLAELMHDATLAQIDPDKEFVNGDDANQYEALRHGFEQLSPKAKDTYRKAREMYVAHNEKVRQAIRERIERSELSPAKRKALLEKMDGEFFKKVKGVYFPLARFGQYVTVVKDSAGNVVSANRSETLNEAEATRKILQSQFPLAGGYKVGKVLKEKEFNAARDGVGRGFMADLFETLDKTNAGEELIDSISQLYLAALPDLSWAKHGIHRKGTPGFSQDARRAFAQNMFHGARYLAKLRYADQLQTHLDDMQEHVASKSDDEKYPSVAAQNVVDEMVKRHDAMMNPQTNPVSTALTSFGFVFHLGLSPASALVNLSQTALVALPVMGAKWGFTKSSAALLSASKQAAGNKNDISVVLKGDELAAYNEAVRSGVIDVTMAHDLAGIAQGEDSKVAAKIRPVMKWASFLFHHAEKFNRQVTFVAAYRLAKEAGADHSKAYAQAVKATYDGHFDYSSSNRARFLQGNWQKVILLFKQYAQNMIYTLTRQAYQAVKAGTPEERSEARKALSGLLVAHAMAAGVFGLPVVGLLLSAASMIGSDDDEPWDAKVALQNLMADTIGQKPAEVVSHGLSRLTPWDISGRVGLDKLLLPDIQEGLSGTPAAQAWIAAMAGPVAGIGVNMVKGLSDMGEGQYQRGLESMMPTALRGPLKAYRYASEGNIDKTGVAINDEVSAAGVLGQALGLSPSETRLAQEGKSAIYSAVKMVQGRRADLVRHFAMASLAQDAEGVQDARKAIARFNERNASNKITQPQLVASVKARRRRIEQSKQGVYLPSKRQEAMEAGRFAVVD